MITVSRLRVKIFADGASLAEMTARAARPEIRGFTTNPTLMRQAGVQDYEAFARDVLRAIPDRPISFEVFSDEFGEMERQARQIELPDIAEKFPELERMRGRSADLIDPCAP